MADVAEVNAAMGSGEWLRTQWLARVAFRMGTTTWCPAHAQRVLAALRRLEASGRVERRMVAAVREGEIGGTLVRFSIPRTEWRITNQDGGE
ncbi:MAG TPA: hypothetical protein VIH71_04660 [Solirubrobacteraceae bacterium]